LQLLIRISLSMSLQQNTTIQK